MAQVKFKRKTTSQINNLPVEDGSFIVDYEAQKAYVDVGENRIPFAGATQLNNQETTSDNQAYSCNYINNEVDRIETKYDELNYCVATISSQQNASSNYVVQLNSINSTDNNMFYLRGNDIIIGPNVNTVKISGAVFMQELPAYSYVWARINVKNSQSVSQQEITSISNGFDNLTAYTSAIIPERIIPVQEGYIITLVADSPGGGIIRAGNNQTWIQIEKIN